MAVEQTGGSSGGNKKIIAVLVAVIVVVGIIAFSLFVVQMNDQSAKSSGQNPILGPSQSHNVQVMKVYYLPGCGQSGNTSSCYIMNIDASYTGSSYWNVNVSDFEVATNISRAFPAYPFPENAGSNGTFVNADLVNGLHDSGDVYFALPQGQAPAKIEYVDESAGIVTSSNSLPPLTQWVLLTNSADGSGPTIELTSGLLNSGPAATVGSTACAGTNFQFTFNDPGGETYISGITLSSGGNVITEAYAYDSAPTTCTALLLTASTAGGNGIIGGATTSLDIFFTTNALSSGSTYSYVITFTNGQSISGSLIAQ